MENSSIGQMQIKTHKYHYRAQFPNVVSLPTKCFAKLLSSGSLFFLSPSDKYPTALKRDWTPPYGPSTHPIVTKAAKSPSTAPPRMAARTLSGSMVPVVTADTSSSAQQRFPKAKSTFGPGCKSEARSWNARIDIYRQKSLQSFDSVACHLYYNARLCPGRSEASPHRWSERHLNVQPRVGRRHASRPLPARHRGVRCSSRWRLEMLRIPLGCQRDRRNLAGRQGHSRSYRQGGCQQQCRPMAEGPVQAQAYCCVLWLGIIRRRHQYLLVRRHFHKVEPCWMYLKQA